MNKILGKPNSKYEYEFSILIPQDNGDFLWHSDHEYVNDAMAELAKTPNGVLSHNVRVAHKQLKVK